MRWEELGEGARELARQIAADNWKPDIILGIARGGLLVGGAISYALDVKNTFTMNVEFYTGIDERLEMPMILPPVPDLVDLGVLVKEFLAGKVRKVRAAVLYEKPGSIVNCEYVWRRTDRWIDFPWSIEAPVAWPAAAPA